VEEHARVLDVLPQGRPDLPQRREPMAYALGERNFVLLELVIKPNASLTVGERVYVGREIEQREKVERVRGRIGYDDMTHAAQSELPFAIEEIVKINETRFMQFYNEAGPVTTRMHVLELLPGLGKKLMMAIVEERRRGGPFKSFKDLDERVKALHAPEKLIAHRIDLEIKDATQKYHLFVQPFRKEDEYGGGYGHERGRR
jgi:putative nucleotide binding protein